MSRLEAHQILFKGQSNVKQMANRLGCTLEDLQQSFGQYCRENPVSEDAWLKDVELGWPWA